MSLPETCLKQLFSKIVVRDLSGERVHSISKIPDGAQGGILTFFKKPFQPQKIKAPQGNPRGASRSPRGNPHYFIIASATFLNAAMSALMWASV